jgi:isopenicillin N synthase-like dioxygenase
MDAAGTNGQIPQLDLRRFDAGEAERTAFLAELRAAAHDVGFFYLTGHGVGSHSGVEPGLLCDLMQSARRFFALSDADKQAIEMVNSPHFRGYNRVASERTRGLPDWREQIDIGAERPALPRDAGLPHWSRLRGPNQWPAALPELRPVVERWQAAAMQVLTRLLRAFALSLGQPPDALEPLYADDPHYLIKLIRYPGRDAAAGQNTDANPIAGPDHGARTHRGTPARQSVGAVQDLGTLQGVGAHKDAGLITLLLQDDQGGLQVETPDGWTTYRPAPAPSSSTSASCWNSLPTATSEPPCTG